MKNNLLCLAALGLLTVGTAQAQSAGTFTLRGGATLISPEVKSGDLSAPSLVGTKVNILPASQVSGGVTYMLTDNIAIDVPLGIPFKHDVVGAGAIANVGKLAEVKALPITVMAQYRFGTPTSSLRPFVGAGATFARFIKPKSTAALSGLTGGTPANPTLMTMKNANGATVQVGVVASLGARWSLDLAVTKVMLKTTGKLSTGQTIETELNPVAFSVGLGYTF